jgi:hypothetical protein
VVFAFAVGALLAMGVVFWEQDLQYSLPTERPAALQQPAHGSQFALPPALARIVSRDAAKPLLIHFYNPDCPCSRFNREHVDTLRRRFAGAVQFVEVVEAAPQDAAPSDEALPYVVDGDGAIAAAFGVYSTPQAVLLDGERRLVYRGNFNTTRYCTTPQTQFVRIAIEALFGEGAPVRDPRAEVAYGCPLPIDAPSELPTGASR